MQIPLAQVRRRFREAPVPVYFGGSFNPFHSGHRAIVETLLDCFALCPLVLLPNRVSPFKCPDNVSGLPDLHKAEENFLHRAALLQIVLAELRQNHPDSSLKLELCEWEREGPSFTADTLRLLLPQKSTGKSCVLALGWDSFCTLHLWKDVRYLLETCILAVFRRAPVGLPIGVGPKISSALITPSSMPKIPDKAAEQVEAEYTVLELDNPCSSTDIRSALAGPRPFCARGYRRLEQDLGPGQLAYILKNNLYCGGFRKR